MFFHGFGDEIDDDDVEAKGGNVGDIRVFSGVQHGWGA